jgi:dihydrolipoamide dehydrogenase
MPSKLLIAPAEAAHVVDRFQEFGLAVDGPVRIDGKAVMARVRRERDRFVGFVVEGVDKLPAADKVRGHARFADDRTLLVSREPDGAPDLTITADRVVIATGSSPGYPPAWAALGPRLVTNAEVFDWQDLPSASRCSDPA